MQGSFVANLVGQYAVEWDNSFSMFTKKYMKYRVAVEEPLAETSLETIKEAEEAQLHSLSSLNLNRHDQQS